MLSWWSILFSVSNKWCSSSLWILFGFGVKRSFEIRVDIFFSLWVWIFPLWISGVGVFAFIFFLIAGELVNLFDLLVIRMLWWPNAKRIRFSILPKKECYQDYKMHFNIFLMNIPVYLVVALLVALFVRQLWINI